MSCEVEAPWNSASGVANAVSPDFDTRGSSIEPQGGAGSGPHEVGTVQPAQSPTKGWRHRGAQN